MRKNLVRLLFLIAGLNQLFAQNNHLEHEIKGFVYERDAQGEIKPLPGAHVFCIKDKAGAVTNKSGAFLMYTQQAFPHLMSASFVGYESDTIEVKKGQEPQFILKSKTLQEVELLDQKKTTTKSLLQTCNIEWISDGELQKAACCNLSESFETNPSVDVSFTDAITGAKQIQMLGLDGVYTQVLFENMPLLRGLSASYGLNYLPGSWIESIQIAKGIGSVVNGFESLSGQINVELYKPATADKLFWNTYINNFGLIENNFIISSPVKNNWKTVLLGHHDYAGQSVDQNGDNFADNPQTQNLSLLNRWSYAGKDNRFITFALRYLTEAKLSGQMNGDDPSTPEYEVAQPFEVDMKTDQAEFSSKVGFLFENPANSFAFLSSLRYHNQETNFGDSYYLGMQHSIYLNTIYQSVFGSSNHVYKMGLSYYGDNYQEKLQLNSSSEENYIRNDQTIGAFSEIQLNQGTRFSSTLGMRADHSKQWGVWYSPRLHLRYNPIENMVIRASVGKAHRQANVMAENVSYFFSSRELQIIDYSYDTLSQDWTQKASTYENLEAEIAWNYGLNFSYNFHVLGKESTFNLDLYQTEFENQVVIDVENVQQINMYNLIGDSYSTSLQLDASIEPAEGWEVKFAQKWNASKTTYGAGSFARTIQTPFVSKYRSLVQVNYSAWQNKWDTHFTLQNIGPSRVPAQGAGEAFIDEFWSPSFNLLSGQFTRRFKKFDWYLGVENALNYLQDNPIRSVENPFSENFDAAMIWGPVMGRKWYSGIRVRIND